MIKSSLFDSVLVVGCGEVTQQRVLPALQSLSSGLSLRRIGLLDVRREEELWLTEGHAPDGAEYMQMPHGQLPLEQLALGGWLGPRTLALNCTPTPYHVPYARELAPHVARLAVEKPLSQCPKEAATLAEFDSHVFPIGHQLFKPEMLELTRRAAAGDLSVDSIGFLQFTLNETRGVGTRQVDDVVWDVGWHGIECLLAPLRAAGIPVSVQIDDVLVSTYRQGPDRPARWTAARIEGHFETVQRLIPFVIRVGKGLDRSFKAVDVFDLDGRLQCSASLDESGSAAHQRLLRELLTSSHPDMQLGLRDVVDVVEACGTAASVAQEVSRYDFGTAPAWLSHSTTSISRTQRIPSARIHHRSD